jgi:hypothetical protein
MKSREERAGKKELRRRLRLGLGLGLGLGLKP